MTSFIDTATEFILGVSQEVGTLFSLSATAFKDAATVFRVCVVREANSLFRIMSARDVTSIFRLSVSNDAGCLFKLTRTLTTDSYGGLP